MQDLQKSEVQREIPSVLVQYTQSTDKNVRMLVMASAHTRKHTCARATHISYTRANRLLAGEAEERYITRLDKPVQRNILEIRSAIIYYRRLFSSWRARRSVTSYPTLDFCTAGISGQGKNSIKRTNGGGRSWKNREKCTAGRRTGKTRVQ